MAAPFLGSALLDVSRRGDEDIQRLAELIRRLRREAGLSQRELAQKLGKVSTWVSKVELGERRLDVFELIDVARALNMTLAQLLQRLGINDQS